MEKTTTVTETFEWCHLCKAFDAVTEKICIDGIEQPLHTICRNNDICWSAELAKEALEGDKEEMAIDALEQEPVKHSIKPVATSTEEVDLISRVDAMGAVQDHFNADGFKGYYDGQKMMDRITALPSADMRGDTE